MGSPQAEEMVEALPWLLVLSAPFLVLIGAFHAGRLPFARLRAPKAPREPPLWGWPEVIVALLVWIGSQLFLLPLLKVLVRGEGPLILAVQASSVALTAAVVVHLVHHQLGQPFSALGLTRTSWWNVLSTILLWAFLIVPLGTVTVLWQLFLICVLDYTPGPQEILESYGRAVSGADWGSIASLVIAAVVVAPFAEELFFRGLIHGMVRARRGFVAGAIVSSLPFALLHWAPGAVAPLFVLGCVLCYVYERTGSLYPAMGFHAVFNGAALVQGFLTASGSA